VDQVQKLLAMHEKASRSKLLDNLSATQVIQGTRSWIGRWTIVTRVRLG
jgi:hypothetical protein